jgi:hypothetical protein
MRFSNPQWCRISCQSQYLRTLFDEETIELVIQAIFDGFVDGSGLAWLLMLVMARFAISILTMAISVKSNFFMAISVISNLTMAISVKSKFFMAIFEIFPKNYY